MTGNSRDGSDPRICGNVDWMAQTGPESLTKILRAASVDGEIPGCSKAHDVRIDETTLSYTNMCRGPDNDLTSQTVVRALSDYEVESVQLTKFSDTAQTAQIRIRWQRCDAAAERHSSRRPSEEQSSTRSRFLDTMTVLGEIAAFQSMRGAAVMSATATGISAMVLMLHVRFIPL